MKNRQTFISVLMVAMAFGTAWAVRGKFGHEQGAAWAGAIGAISVVLVAKRADWYSKVFRIALAAAVGWGLSGMISYGAVVGYGRGNDFLNVYYGLMMLFVIGVLYGFLGGGFFALALAESRLFKVAWASLISEMIAMALLTYGLLINQLEWLMTPPRSELWAACLGAAIALAWYILRHQQRHVLKVAIWSALGAGFGFSFGNFLQVIGAGPSLPFNLWNVMEYSIGFFGGLGMAYGTLTSSWPSHENAYSKQSNLIPVLFLVVFIPLVAWDQSFVAEKLDFILRLGGTTGTIFWFQVVALISIILAAVFILSKHSRTPYDFPFVKSIFIISMGVYTFLSFLLTGITIHPVEQYLYLVNIVVILSVQPSLQDNFIPMEEFPEKWIAATASSIVIIAILAMIAIQSHGELSGTQIRFK
jgi:hypothetical protein